MTLTVLSVAFPFAPVGSDAVGGAEQILSAVDRALMAAGHRSLVVACAGSQAAGELWAFPAAGEGELDENTRRWIRGQCRAAFAKALRSAPVDVIHMHGLDFDEYVPAGDTPVLATLHMPISWYREAAWSRYRGRVRFQCVSHAQRKTCPAEMGEVEVIENGVSVPPADAGRGRGAYALALGRICPEKNFHEALMAGTLAGVPVWLGGQTFPYREHRQYFENDLRPLLGSGRGLVAHRFLGPLTRERKQWLLRSARCLLHPTLAPETSSLVAMEAMAAGTPVIAYRSGALPEVVEDGVTGFLVDNVNEMAEAMGRVHTLSPEACRRRARERFSEERMARQYLELYAALAGTRRAARRYA